MCFFSGHSLWGRKKTHKQTPPQIPGQSREHFVYVFFSLCVSFRSLKNCFGTINFVKITKQSLYKANSFACSLANRDKPVAATLQRKCSGGFFVMIAKIITKRIVPRNYFVIVSARMVVLKTIR